MTNDYKSIYSYNNKKKKNKTMRIIIALLLLVAGYVFFSNLVDKKKIIEIQNLFSSNKIQDAIKIFSKIEKSSYHKTSKNIINGVFLLNKKEYEKALSLFKLTNMGDTLINHSIFINYFIENLNYKALDIYINFVGETYREYSYYKAVLATAMFNSKESESFLNKIKTSKERNLGNKIKQLRRLNNELKTGKINYIFDINGLPLAYYDIELKKTLPLKDVNGYNFENFTNSLSKGVRFFTLTLNKNIQNTIHKIFNTYSLKGSFILFKSMDNSMISAYSSDTNPINSVFQKRYEPGSIVKLLTLYAYFKNNIKNIFPYECKSLTINNKPFYDWISHHTVNTFEEALAWSCNIGFAKIGMLLGLQKLEKVYSEFLFNRNNIKDMFVNFKMGEFNSEYIDNDYKLAKVSVGLSVFNNNSNTSNYDLISMTTVHAGLISSAIANKGVINSPFLIKNIKSVLGIGYYNHKNIIIKKNNAPLIFNKIRNAMVKVITDKSGTGKNSFVPFVKVALKTGTAGNKKPYNAILTGFFPSNRPEYAFAFILEHSGPSKNKGAKFLKDFLIAFHKKEN